MTESHKLENKIKRLEKILAPFSPPELTVFPSEKIGHRMRAEFRIWHEDEKITYAMTAADGSRIELETFPPACAAINDAMPRLLAAIKSETILRRKLFQVDFHATLRGEMMITLIYHKPLNEAWQSAATALAQTLSCQIIGRARKQKYIIGRDFVHETLTVLGKKYHYRQYESSFSQPNARICEQMIAWAKTHCASSGGDLLELYCGNGNFTLPLAGVFRQVLATEVSKRGILALSENIKLNQLDNIKIARLSAEEFSQALAQVRPFRRLQQADIVLSDYDFSTVLVDPPRAGVDQHTLQWLQRFPFIVYISCNPETLAENLQQLNQSHKITAAALFDQFPNSAHIESGVFLQKRMA